MLLLFEGVTGRGGVVRGGPRAHQCVDVWWFSPSPTITPSQPCQWYNSFVICGGSAIGKRGGRGPDHRPGAVGGRSQWHRRQCANYKPNANTVRGPHRPLQITFQLQPSSLPETRYANRHEGDFAFAGRSVRKSDRSQSKHKTKPYCYYYSDVFEWL